MCASYESRFNFSQLKIDFTLADRQLPLNLETRGTIRPTVTAPYVYREGGDRLLAAGRFGVWQPWMAGKRLSTFNCVSEKAAGSRMWRPLLERTRALVPAEAYHEWTGAKGEKVRWRFTVDGGAPFVFAGVWCAAAALDGEPKGFAAGETVRSFALFTCAPNALQAGYHDRMPVILDPGDYDAWLDPENDNPSALLTPFPAERMAVEQRAE